MFYVCTCSSQYDEVMSLWSKLAILSCACPLSERWPSCLLVVSPSVAVIAKLFFSEEKNNVGSLDTCLVDTSVSSVIKLANCHVEEIAFSRYISIFG